MRSKTRMSNITDGTSNAFMFGEAMGGRVNSQIEMGYTWMGFGPLPTAPGLTDNNAPGRRWYFFSSEHPGTVQFALADGAVRNISLNIDYRTYILLSAMHDGQTVSVDAAQ